MLAIKKATEFYGVSKDTLRRWDASDKIKTIRTKGGHRRYIINKNTKTQMNKINEYLMHMPESLLLNKKMICKTKLNFLNKNIHHTQLFQIPDQVSTLKELDFVPFWNNYSLTMSKRLWSPPVTDFLGSDSSSSNLFSINSMLNSKLLIQKPLNLPKRNFQKTSCLSLQFSRPDITEKENTKPKQPVKHMITRKLRIYPNRTQKLFFNKCFGVTRYIYNEVVEYIDNKYKSKIKQMKEESKNGCVKHINNKQCCNDIHENYKYFCSKHLKSRIDYGFKLNLPFIRKEVLVNDSDLSNSMKWLKDVPYDTRQLVIKDFIAAYKAAIKNFKNGHNKGFQMGYKSKRNQTQIFHINKKAITKDLNLFKRRKIGKLRTRKRMTRWLKNNIMKIESDCKIIRYHPDQYYVLLTVQKEVEYNEAKLKSVSLDPGVRTFQTFYSPDGVAGKLGDNMINDYLLKYAKRIDELNKIKTERSKGRTKKNILKRQSLLRTKIKNVVDDMHWKVIDFLVKNFETIIIPTFETKKMACKENRLINNKATRMMLTLSHYKFKERLKYKATSLKRNYIETTEEYTSKTCGNCGSLDSKLGSKKIYNCNDCNFKMDRDINGARNILLKYISKISNRVKIQALKHTLIKNKTKKNISKNCNKSTKVIKQKKCKKTAQKKKLMYKKGA